MLFLPLLQSKSKSKSKAKSKSRHNRSAPSIVVNGGHCCSFHPDCQYSSEDSFFEDSLVCSQRFCAPKPSPVQNRRPAHRLGQRYPSASRKLCRNVKVVKKTKKSPKKGSQRAPPSPSCSPSLPRALRQPQRRPLTLSLGVCQQAQLKPQTDPQCKHCRAAATKEAQQNPPPPPTRRRSPTEMGHHNRWFRIQSTDDTQFHAVGLTHGHKRSLSQPFSAHSLDRSKSPSLNSNMNRSFTSAQTPDSGKSNTLTGSRQCWDCGQAKPCPCHSVPLLPIHKCHAPLKGILKQNSSESHKGSPDLHVHHHEKSDGCKTRTERKDGCQTKTQRKSGCQIIVEAQIEHDNSSRKSRFLASRQSIEKKLSASCLRRQERMNASGPKDGRYENCWEDSPTNMNSQEAKVVCTLDTGGNVKKRAEKAAHEVDCHESKSLEADKAVNNIEEPEQLEAVGIEKPKTQKKKSTVRVHSYENDIMELHNELNNRQSKKDATAEVKGKSHKTVKKAHSYENGIMELHKKFKGRKAQKRDVLRSLTKSLNQRISDADDGCENKTVESRREINSGEGNISHVVIGEIDTKNQRISSIFGNKGNRNVESDNERNNSNTEQHTTFLNVVNTAAATKVDGMEVTIAESHNEKHNHGTKQLQSVENEALTTVQKENGRTEAKVSAPSEESFNFLAKRSQLEKALNPGLGNKKGKKISLSFSYGKSSGVARELREEKRATSIPDLSQIESMYSTRIGPPVNPRTESLIRSRSLKAADKQTRSLDYRICKSPPYSTKSSQRKFTWSNSHNYSSPEKQSMLATSFAEEEEDELKSQSQSKMSQYARVARKKKDRKKKSKEQGCIEVGQTCKEGEEKEKSGLVSDRRAISLDSERQERAPRFSYKDRKDSCPTASAVFPQKQGGTSPFNYRKASCSNALGGASGKRISSRVISPTLERHLRNLNSFWSQNRASTASNDPQNSSQNNSPLHPSQWDKPRSNSLNANSYLSNQGKSGRSRSCSPARNRQSAPSGPIDRFDQTSPVGPPIQDPAPTTSPTNNINPTAATTFTTTSSTSGSNSLHAVPQSPGSGPRSSPRISRKQARFHLLFLSACPWGSWCIMLHTAIESPAPC